MKPLDVGEQDRRLVELVGHCPVLLECGRDRLGEHAQHELLDLRPLRPFDGELLAEPGDAFAEHQARDRDASTDDETAGERDIAGDDRRDREECDVVRDEEPSAAWRRGEHADGHRTRDAHEQEARPPVPERLGRRQVRDRRDDGAERGADQLDADGSSPSHRLHADHDVADEEHRDGDDGAALRLVVQVRTKHDRERKQAERHEDTVRGGDHAHVMRRHRRRLS